MDLFQATEKMAQPWVPLAVRRLCIEALEPGPAQSLRKQTPPSLCREFWGLLLARPHLNHRRMWRRVPIMWTLLALGLGSYHPRRETLPAPKHTTMACLFLPDCQVLQTQVGTTKGRGCSLVVLAAHCLFCCRMHLGPSSRKS